MAVVWQGCLDSIRSSSIRVYAAAAAAGILGQMIWRRPSSLTVHLFVQIPAQRYARNAYWHDSNVSYQAVSLYTDVQLHAF